MTYLKANVATQALETYPYTFRNFKADNPNVSVRKDMSKLTAYGVHPVTEITKPAPGNAGTHRVIEDTPVFIDPNWTQTWTEQLLSAEEQAQIILNNELNDVQVALAANPWVTTFADMTVAEVETFIGTEITDLASAKSTIEKLAIICLLLAKREKN